MSMVSLLLAPCVYIPLMLFATRVVHNHAPKNINEFKYEQTRFLVISSLSIFTATSLLAPTADEPTDPRFYFKGLLGTKMKNHSGLLSFLLFLSGLSYLFSVFTSFSYLNFSILRPIRLQEWPESYLHTPAVLYWASVVFASINFFINENNEDGNVNLHHAMLDFSAVPNLVYLGILSLNMFIVDMVCCFYVFQLRTTILRPDMNSELQMKVSVAQRLLRTLILQISLPFAISLSYVILAHCCGVELFTAYVRSLIVFPLLHSLCLLVSLPYYRIIFYRSLSRLRNLTVAQARRWLPFPRRPRQNDQNDHFPPPPYEAI